MGFLRDLGKVVGSVSGVVIGGTVSLVGDIVDSDTIRDIGEGVFKVNTHTGESVGRLAEGACKCVSGILGEDKKKLGEGANELKNVAVETVTGMGKGIACTAKVGATGIGAVLEGDTKKAVDAGKTLVKVAAIGALSVSVLDVIDGSLDGTILDFNGNGVPDFLEKADTINTVGRNGLNFTYGDNPPQYWVNDLSKAGGGYVRTMPDASVLNNISGR